MEEQINRQDEIIKELKSENRNLKGVIVAKDSKQTETEVCNIVKKLSDSFDSNPYNVFCTYYICTKILYRVKLKSRRRRL